MAVRRTRATTSTAMRTAILVVFSVLIGGSVDAFQVPINYQRRVSAAASSSTRLGVLSDPRQNKPRKLSIQQQPQRQRSQQNKPFYPNKARSNSKQKRIYKKKDDDVWSSGRWTRAVLTESRVLACIQALSDDDDDDDDDEPVVFPGIRECNAALAAFGDGGDMLRALRMFGKMKKASAVAHRRSLAAWTVPSPTLVTYSTMMSRAIAVGKPQVALRLWRLMRLQSQFFSNDSAVATKPADQISSGAMPVILPDVKAANILMNCYAKLGDLSSAKELLEQMIEGNGRDVPRITPNIITYNTLLDACLKCGDLDAALEVRDQIEETQGVLADARTYTTLIATVARKASAASGASDPTLAFTLLEEMQSQPRKIRPNGMTYSALIDVCGRCRRSDLALKGLRLMLDQKTERAGRFGRSYKENKQFQLLEVGAWTAAINACGKSGRLQAAIKLFYTMPNFGVYPNDVTCGCLTDCLLKHGKIAETLEVLRYMKKYRITPSEIMYTSLMSSAGRLVKFENDQKQNQPKEEVPELNPTVLPASYLASPKIPDHSADEFEATQAIEVYTELIVSLMQSSKLNKQKKMEEGKPNDDDANELYRVFLVFQEMKAAGAEPDLACYNTLLKACANVGDVERAQSVFDQIHHAVDIDPNDKSWREMIRAAGKARRSDVAISTWKTALEAGWQPSVGTLSVWIGAMLECSKGVDPHARTGMLTLIVKLFQQLTIKPKSPSFNNLSQWRMDLINTSEMVETPRTMLIFLEAMVTLEAQSSGVKKEKLRKLASHVVSYPCFKKGLPPALFRNQSYRSAYKTAMSFAEADANIP